MPNSNYHGGTKESRCYFCDCGPPLHEHHVIPQRFGGPDSQDNIVELCQLCHKRVERLYDKSFYEWFGIADESGKRQFHRQCSHGPCKNTADLKFMVATSTGANYRRFREFLCFRHANEYYSRGELEYIWQSDCVQGYRLNDTAKSLIEKKRIRWMRRQKFSVDADGTIKTESLSDSWKNKIREKYPIKEFNIYEIDWDQVELSKDDLELVGVENITPLSDDGSELDRFEIMSDFVVECSDRVSEYFD